MSFAEENPYGEDFEYVDSIYFSPTTSVLRIRNKKVPAIFVLKSINQYQKQSAHFQEQEAYKQKSEKTLTELSNLSHDNIASLLDFKIRQIDSSEGWTENICIHIRFQYGSGGNLRSEIERLNEQNKLMSESRMTQLALNVVTALQYAYEEQKVIHGNLKPENILLSKNDDDEELFMVSDFGLLDFSKYKKTRTWDSKQRYYIAPETLNQNYDSTNIEKQDCYSLGAILAEVICGDIDDMPHSGQIELQSKNEQTLQPDELLTTQRSQNQFQTARTVVASSSQIVYVDQIYSQEFIYLVNWMLQVDPDKRPNYTGILNYLTENLSELLINKRDSNTSFVKNINTSERRKEESDNFVKKEESFLGFAPTKQVDKKEAQMSARSDIESEKSYGERCVSTINVLLKTPRIELGEPAFQVLKTNNDVSEIQLMHKDQEDLIISPSVLELKSLNRELDLKQNNDNEQFQKKLRRDTNYVSKSGSPPKKGGPKKEPQEAFDPKKTYMIGGIAVFLVIFVTLLVFGISRLSLRNKYENSPLQLSLYQTSLRISKDKDQWKNQPELQLHISLAGRSKFENITDLCSTFNQPEVEECLIEIDILRNVPFSYDWSQRVMVVMSDEKTYFESNEVQLVTDPSPPLALTQVNDLEDSIEIDWQIPVYFGISEISHYIVSYKSLQPDSDRLFKQSAPIYMQKFILYNLDRGQNYDVKIQAVNKHGRKSVYSQKIVVSTLSGHGKEVEMFPEIEIIAEDKMRIKWRHNETMHYEVYVQNPDDESKFDDVTKQCNEIHDIFTRITDMCTLHKSTVVNEQSHIEWGDQIQVIVGTYSSENVFLWSEVSDNQVTLSTVPAPPQSLTQIKDEGKINLSWALPYNGGDEVLGYIVMWDQGSENWVEAARVPSNNFKQSKGIRSGVNYNYKVIAFNKNGYGLASLPLLIILD